MSPTEVLVPCLDIGAGTQTATIRDARTKKPVRLSGVKKLVLVDRRACVSLRVISEERGQALVRISDNAFAWVVPHVTER